MSDREIYPMPQLSEASFPDLAMLMRSETNFPATYAEWQALWLRRRREEEQRGFRVIFVDVRPAAFAQFCKGFIPPLPPSWGALTKFVGNLAGGLP